MTLLSDVAGAPLSGSSSIDALLASGFPWNYIGRSTMYFSFAVGAQPAGAANLLAASSVTTFNAQQQVQVHAILAYVSQLTGIKFAETADPAQADWHFANASLYNDYDSQDVSVLTATAADEYIYLDSNDPANLAPVPGNTGYELLLHEIGHALGLKHPDEGPVQLPLGTALGQDNSASTLMSDTLQGGPYSAYNALDVAALEWLYGGDGLGGNYGVGTAHEAIIGSVGADALMGTAGNDRFLGSAGNDTINGSWGLDTAVYANTRANYGIAHTANGFAVTALSGNEGSDTLLNLERLEFLDRNVALDIDGHAGQAYRLYQAAFDRAPDLPGLGYQMNDLDIGHSLSWVAANFIASPEFQSKYGNTMDDPAFVTLLYQHVLHRNPQQWEVDYHVVQELRVGYTRADVLTFFSESPENQANVVGTIQNGMDYIPVG